jgi:hypothetical protein
MRKGMRIAGGILTIFCGFTIIVGTVFVTDILFVLIPWTKGPLAWSFGGLIALGVVALIGGICALRGKMWGLALAGAICAIFPIIPAGILAVIFISITKRYFT